MAGQGRRWCREGRNQLPAPSSKARRARTATTTARQEGARCTGRPELRGPTARQGAAPRPSPGAPGGFPRSVPRAPADRSGRFQPPPVPRPTAWVSGETEGRADLGGQGRRGLGDRNKGLEAYFGGKTCETMGGGASLKAHEYLGCVRRLGVRGAWFPQPSSGD